MMRLTGTNKLSWVGQSTGEHDEDESELEDVRAALNYLVQDFPTTITLCGFSFARALVEVECQMTGSEFD